jgi:hypothetical protein
MTIRTEALAVLKDRLTQLQAEASMALLRAEAGEIEGVHEHLGEVYMQLGACMIALWHGRLLLAEKMGEGRT